MIGNIELEHVATAARQVIADGLALTGKNLKNELYGNKPDPVSVEEIVEGAFDVFDTDPSDGGGSIIVNIGDRPLSDVGDEIESRGRRTIRAVDLPGRGDEVVVAVWPLIDMKALFACIGDERDLIIACRSTEDVDKASDVVDMVIEAESILAQAGPGSVEFEGIGTAPSDGELSEAIRTIQSRLSLVGIRVAGPGVTGAELESYLPLDERDGPSIKLVNAESVTAVEEVHEAKEMGFAVTICFDDIRIDRINPGLEGIRCR